MRAILIDPYTQTVREVEHNGDYKQIYELIGAQTFDLVRVDRTNAIYIDDEGLLTATDDTRYFGLKGYGQPIAGKGLMLGADQMGETIGATLTKAQVEVIVEWPKVRFTGMTTTESREDHPILGKGVMTIRNEAHFEPREDDTKEKKDE